MQRGFCSNLQLTGKFNFLNKYARTDGEGGVERERERSFLTAARSNRTARHWSRYGAILHVSQRYGMCILKAKLSSHFVY